MRGGARLGDPAGQHFVMSNSQLSRTDRASREVLTTHMSVEESYNQWSATYDTDANRTRDLDQAITCLEQRPAGGVRVDLSDHRTVQMDTQPARAGQPQGSRDESPQ